MGTPVKKRVREWRQRQAEKGGRSLSVWLDPDSAKMLDVLIERSGDRVSSVVARAIQNLFEVTGNVPECPPVETRDPALEELKNIMSARQSVQQAKTMRLVQWIRAMRERGNSYEEMADILNEFGVPTLAGEGRWERGMFPTILTINPESPR